MHNGFGDTEKAEKAEIICVLTSAKGLVIFLRSS